MPTVAIDDLRSLVVRLLRQRYNETEAEAMAEVVLFGELCGRPTHGILRVLPGSYGALDEVPSSPPLVERTTSNAGRVVGSPGMLVMAMATDLAVDIATEHGFAVVTTRGSRSTTGSLTYYVERLVDSGLVAMVSSGTLGYVSPPGAAIRALGTNPIAFGVPGRGMPLIVDIATSAGTVGEVMSAAASGAALAPGIAVDSHGNQTTDGAAVMNGGALLPFGGHKGLGLSMFVEVLNAGLTGASPGLDPRSDWGNVVVAFSLSLLGDPEPIRDQVQAEVDRLSALTRIPGHNSLATRDAALARGTVEVDDESYQKLVELAGAG